MPRSEVIVFFAAIMLTTLLLAQETYSTGSAAQQLRRWIAAYDGRDGNVYRQFLKTNFAPQAENMFPDISVRRQTGAFDLIKIENETPTRVIALLNGRDSDKVGRIIVEVEAAEPHHIVKLQARAIPRPPDLALPHLKESELVASLHERLNDVVSADAFSGAVLLAKNGQPIYAQAYGLADREQHIPNSLNTRFRIGSMNKMFTAIAVLQLVSAGQVKLDEPVAKYLPDYPNRELASKVTIHHLLSHTGGTGDFFGPQFRGHRLKLRTHQDYIELFGGRPISFEPGSRFEYSNYGFIILGAVIEKVTSQNYYSYVQDHVYRPAGMISTGSKPEDKAVPDLSVGYTKQEGNVWQRNSLFLPYRGTSAGGGYSTVGDLLRFANALQAQKLLNAYYTELLTTPKVEMSYGGYYAYGFQNRTINGSHCWGHSGGSAGMNGELDVCQDSIYTVVVLANIDPEAASHIAEFIVNRLPAPNVKP